MPDARLMGFFDNPLVANVVAFGIALLAIFIFEWIKRPCLVVDIFEERYADVPAIDNVRQAARIVHLKAINRPIYQSWIQRNPATNCRSSITVRDATGNPVRQVISTKWGARQEPVRVVSILPTGRPIQIVNDYLVDLCDRLDINANNEGEGFAVAVKVEGDADCYLFRGASYRSGNQWRLPECSIPQGEFTLEVFVRADNGKSETKRYQLRNNRTTRQGLALDPL